MKFKIISASDVIILREARRILKNLKKQENTLNCLENSDSTLDPKIAASKYKDWKTVARTHWRMLDELEALHISVEENGDMSLNA